MNQNELKLAQKAIFKASHSLSEAGLRLQGTVYEPEYKRMWFALSSLYNRILNDIKK